MMSGEPPDPAPAPFFEVKRSLGRAAVTTFACELLDRAADRAVLRYVLPAEARVAGLTLPAGTVTLAFYWPDRPYNVYHWLASDGSTLGLYLNVSGPVTIHEDGLEWEDWIVDVLALPDGRVHVLDESELDDPALQLAPGARVAVEHALAAALADLPSVIAETTSATRALLESAEPTDPPVPVRTALPGHAAGD